MPRCGLVFVTWWRIERTLRAHISSHLYLYKADKLQVDGAHSALKSSFSVSVIPYYCFLQYLMKGLNERNMTLSARDSLVDLEHHRRLLEQNVARLRASLQHWQAWEIEYEGMKEEILGLGENAIRADLVVKPASLSIAENTDTCHDRRMWVRMLASQCYQDKIIYYRLKVNSFISIYSR